MSILKNKIVGVALVGLAASLMATPSMAQEKMRIALDTNPVHVRNKGVEIFVDELKKRTGDRFDITVYPSGQLFRDRDIPRALRQGAVEMGVPGTWQLDSVEPTAALPTLPMFYGVDIPTVYKVLDGEIGDYLNEVFEKRMRVKIPGKWMALGMQHTFGVSDEIDYDTYKGKKIRYPGGTGNAARISKLGGIPVLVPWPDVPLGMSQGVMDGLITTYESASSSKLMDSGMKYAFDDENMFNQYVPMISDAFWKKQPKDVQDAILESWDIAVTWERENALKAQDKARENLINQGLKVIVPSKEQITAARKDLMQIQPQLVEEMKIDPEVTNKIYEALKEAGVEY